MTTVTHTVEPKQITGLAPRVIDLESKIGKRVHPEIREDRSGKAPKIPLGPYRSIKDVGKPIEVDALLRKEFGLQFNVDLSASSPHPDMTQHGWETCAATGGISHHTDTTLVAFYTANWFAAYSVNFFNSWKFIEPYALCAQFGESFCCDQMAVFDPQFKNFIWLLQTQAGNYLLAVASPDEIAQSNGNRWTVWVLRASKFDSANPPAPMDRPNLAVGRDFLYMTTNLEGKHSIGIRFRLSELNNRGNINIQFFETQNYWMKPAQNSNGLFVVEESTSVLRVFSWLQDSGIIQTYAVNISTIPNVDFATPLPGGIGNWLDVNSKIDNQIMGATVSGQKLWACWTGARKISGQSNNSFPYPHIGIAVIDINSRALVEQRYVWNPDFAFAWPDVATNLNGDVGLSFCAGGNAISPQWGVGILAGTSANQFYWMTSGQTNGAGGHYTTIARNYPDEKLFVASGFNQIYAAGPPRKLTNHPHFVTFAT